MDGHIMRCGTRPTHLRVTLPKIIGITSHGAPWHVPTLELLYVHQVDSFCSPVGSGRLILVMYTTRLHVTATDSQSLNPLECKDNYSAILNNVKLVHWLLMGVVLHLVRRGGDWAGPQPARSPPRCTNVTAHSSMYQSPYCCIMLRCSAVLMCALKG